MISELFTKRLRIFIVFIFFLLGSISIKLFSSSIINNKKLSRYALNLWNRAFPLVGERGLILDNKGRVLVENEPVISLYAVPNQVKDKEKASLTISSILGVDYQTIYKKITKKASIITFHPEGKKLDYEKAKALMNQNIDGIYLIQDYKRYYPYEKYMASLIGFCGIDNNGLAGLENTYDEYLKGKNGTLEYMMDAKGGLLPNQNYTLTSPSSGLHLKLTLNLDIQNVIEREMENAMALYNPSEISCVVMDPNNGEILAIGCRPTYNNNHYQEYDSSVYNRLLPVYNSFEPGSTFKAMTFAAAVNEKKIDIDHDYYYDKGYEIVSGQRIKSWKKGGHGLQTYLEVLQNSSNPGFVEISRKLGKEKMYEYVERYGFLDKTHVDIQGENKGIFFKKENFKELECATTSFGQGISVTAIQLVTAFSSVINGGILYKPHIASSLLNASFEEVYRFEKEEVRRTIQEETSLIMRRALECVVAKGSGKRAYLDGYRVGGKTGTAQIAENGAYKEGKYILSFIGGAPMNNPKVVVYFSLKEPHNCIQYGGTTVGPIIKNILQDILPILNVKKDYSGPEKEFSWLDEKTVIVENYIGKKRRQLYSPYYSFAFLGEGDTVIDQVPRQGERIGEGGQVMILLGY